MVLVEKNLLIYIEALNRRQLNVSAVADPHVDIHKQWKTDIPLFYMNIEPQLALVSDIIMLWPLKQHFLMYTKFHEYCDFPR